MGATSAARRAALVSVIAMVAAAALVVGVLGAAPPSRASGFDPAEAWAWSSNELVLASGTAKAARLERLPDGRVAALVVVAGTAYGQPTGDVVLTRVREASGTWGAAEETWLGTEPVASRTFDTFADSAGRIVTVWAVKSATSGQWPVRSVSRAADGTWGAVQELYVAQTDGALSDTLEIAGIAPRLVPAGDTVTLPWTTVANAPSSRVDVDTDPFRARRWTAGSWAAPLDHDGYGAEAVNVSPLLPTQRSVWGNPTVASRTSDGRVSFVYSLYKHRPTHSMDHPLSDGHTGPNLPNVWDGIPERPWDSTSTTAWVMHLDPGQGWVGPAKLIVTGDSPVLCGTVSLPSNPPLVTHWSEWKAFSLDPGIRTSCPGEESRTRSASYDDDGSLRISLERYRSDPSAEVKINQFLDDACDDPAPDSRFCFDSWGSTDWGISWPGARIGVAPGADRPGIDAVREDPWPVDLTTTVATTSGPVTVHEQAGAGNAIRFVRGGSEAVWTPDAGNAAAVRVQRVFAHGGDVAVFYYRTFNGATTDCGMAVLHGATMTVQGPLAGCVAAPDASQQDVVQLADGRLAAINGKAIGSPVRIYGPTQTATQTPTQPQPSSSAPTAPAPSAPAPPAPAPVPPVTTFTATTPPSVTGKAKVGKTLKARPGTWTPAPTSVSYQWRAGSKAIRKATSAKLRLTRTLRGKRISVRITIARPGVTTVVRTVKVSGRVG